MSGAGVAAGRPLVSVVIPTRDRPDTVVRAIRSALAQTYPRLEVSVVDDGSDPPLRLAHDVVTDPRVQVTRIDRSAGPAASRNLAVERSTGELLAFLDDDDEWCPEKIERQVKCLSASSEDVAAVQCGYEFHDDEGLVFRFVPDLARDLPRLLLERPGMAPSTVLLRRSVFEEMGGFDQTLHRMEDWDLWLRLADRYRVALMPDVLVRRWGHRGRALAGIELPYREEMAARLAPRIARRPEPERRRLSIHHLTEVAVMQARAGQRRRALGSLGRAARMSPLAPEVRRAAAVAFLVDTPPWRLASRAKRWVRSRGTSDTTDGVEVRSW